MIEVLYTSFLYDALLGIISLVMRRVLFGKKKIVKYFYGEW
jgi:hypothetical protein